MKRFALKYLLVGAGCLIVVFVGLIGFSYFFPPTYEADTRLPGTNSIVEVQLQPMHLYLAEYRRAIVLHSPNAADVRMEMFPDTGGYLRTQLYRLKDGRFVIEGFFDAFVVDPEKQSISHADAKIVNTAQYLGAFDDTGDGRWRFIPASESPKQWLQITKPANRLRAASESTFLPPLLRA